MSYVDAIGAVRFAADKLQKVGLFQTEHMFCDLYCLEPGQAQKPHAHAGATKFYYVLEGRAVATLGDESRELGPGQLAWSAPGENHGIANPGPARCVLLVVMGPNPNRS
jgi:quercetin dioxygenase-like cupin family protein